MNDVTKTKFVWNTAPTSSPVAGAGSTWADPTFKPSGWTFNPLTGTAPPSPRRPYYDFNSDTNLDYLQTD